MMAAFTYGFVILILMNIPDALYCLSPVILVPGDGGSQIEVKLNKPRVPKFYCKKKTDRYESLWVNEAEYFVVACLSDNMRLVYSNKSHTTAGPPGVDTRVPGFGETEKIEYLDGKKLFKYYRYMAKALVSSGYLRNVSLRGAPYDFRKAPNELGPYYKDLQHLIETTYTINNRTKVVLIGHSMGNQVLLYFLNHLTQPWKDKFIRAFISLAAPWGGSVMSTKMLISGYTMQIKLPLNPLSVREMQRTFPTSLWLQPSDTVWGPEDTLVVSPYRNYTAADYKVLFDDISFSQGWDMMQDTKYLTSSMIPPGVEVHCLHGYGLQTPKTLMYKSGGKQWYNHQPKIVTWDGDGTVSTKSLSLCQRWIKQQKQNVFYKAFEKVQHYKMLSDNGVIEYIKKLLLF